MALPDDLRAQITKIAPITLAGEHLLEPPEVFLPLLANGGLQRGWLVKVGGNGSTRALLWALLSTASQAGGWVATVDVSGVSLAAAHELGMAIERVLVVDCPHQKQWTSVVASLIGAVDVVIFDSPYQRVTPSEVRRMVSRARERGSVLVELERLGTRRSSGIDSGVHDIEFSTSPVGWAGIGDGHGYVHERRVHVEVSGRRMGGGVRSGSFCLPASDGTIQQLGQVAPARLRAI